ncbi:MAG: MYXO-CTERM sorting domain-containing protein, partial [Sorangiineae bacterium PRO1]|nr:MYXO-CTERM sorting domain-containing protein [Sorangiineae bacterium PRO1]
GKDGGTGLDVGEDDGGCGCRVPARSAPSSSWLVLTALGALFARRRRR